MCSLIQTFRNAWRAQKRFLQEIWVSLPIPLNYLCSKNDSKTKNFGLEFSKPRFVKPPRSLRKTAFEYKWKVFCIRMTFGSYFNITSSNHRAWIRKSFNPAALRARKVRVLFTLSMRRLALGRHRNGAALSTAASPRIRARWQLAFPQRKPQEKVQRRVMGS